MENVSTIKKDSAKVNIILFVIGVLAGAVISTAAFFVYAKTLGVNSNTGDAPSQQIQGGTPPEMPSSENGLNNQGSTPPEKPSENSESESN